MTLSISIPKIWPGINGVTRLAASAVGPLCGERDRQREREREREREKWREVRHVITGQFKIWIIQLSI